MPVESIRLVLEPDGFFDRNPALDIPDPAVASAAGNGDSCCSSS
jgi:primary-amine oxidase